MEATPIDGDNGSVAERADGSPGQPEERDSLTVQTAVDDERVRERDCVEETRARPACLRSKMIARTYFACSLVLACVATYIIFCTVSDVGLPYVRVLDYMEPAQCNVTSHEVIRRVVDSDGRVRRTMPAVGVTFYAPTADNASAPSVLWHARARKHVLPSASWMEDYEKEGFYMQYPMGSAVTCYYSRKDWDFAAVSDDKGGLGWLVFSWITPPLLVFVSVVLMAWFIWFVHTENLHR